MKYEVIKNSESNTGYKIKDNEFRGVICGLLCGWQFEFKNAKNEIDYGSVIYFDGTPDDYVRHYDAIDGFLWQIERYKGYEPTGRVIFRGYYEEEYDFEEHETYVKEVSDEQLSKYIA